jgi:hypothetical protein
MAAGEVVRLLGEALPEAIYPWLDRHKLAM